MTDLDWSQLPGISTSVGNVNVMQIVWHFIWQQGLCSKEKAFLIFRGAAPNNFFLGAFKQFLPRGFFLTVSSLSWLISTSPKIKFIVLQMCFLDVSGSVLLKSPIYKNSAFKSAREAISNSYNVLTSTKWAKRMSGGGRQMVLSKWIEELVWVFIGEKKKGTKSFIFYQASCLSHKEPYGTLLSCRNKAAILRGASSWSSSEVGSPLNWMGEFLQKIRKWLMDEGSGWMREGTVCCLCPFLTEERGVWSAKIQV